MERKIKSVKLYQCATFEKRSETHFTVLPVSGKPGVSIEFIPEMACIEIKSLVDHILVPMTNIACIYIWTGAADEYVVNRTEARAVTGTLTAQDIKRPKKLG